MKKVIVTLIVVGLLGWFAWNWDVVEIDTNALGGLKDNLKDVVGKLSLLSSSVDCESFTKTFESQQDELRIVTNDIAKLRGELQLDPLTRLVISQKYPEEYEKVMEEGSNKLKSLEASEQRLTNRLAKMREEDNSRGEDSRCLWTPKNPIK